MSLPSRAVYYNKNNIIVHEEFVNVGWFINEQIWLDCINNLPKVFDAVIIDCYGVKFPIKWINNDQYRDYLIELFRDRENAYFYKTKIINGVHYFNRVYGRNWYDKYKLEHIKIQPAWDNIDHTNMVSIIRRTMPETIAKDIVGVQPMTEIGDTIFTIRTRYNSKNKFIRWIEFKWNNIKEQYRRMQIYTKSMLRIIYE